MHCIADERQAWALLRAGKKKGNNDEHDEDEDEQWGTFIGSHEMLRRFQGNVFGISASDARRMHDNYYRAGQGAMGYGYYRNGSGRSNARAGPQENLPLFMRGMPREVDPPPALPHHRAVSSIPVPASVPSWPRHLGFFDFFVPRCIMHTHPEMPLNARLSNYFACDGHSNSRVTLVGAGGGPGAPAQQILNAVERLQSMKCIQVRWEVHHATGAGAMSDLGASVLEKLSQLVQHRPVTFGAHASCTHA
eukprot:SAG11_NODE_135_length_15131_cov_9.906599_10_plen_249_part_00